MFSSNFVVVKEQAAVMGQSPRNKYKYNILFQIYFFKQVEETLISLFS